ncbi:hypothetical protein DDV21_008160 [Streptococcus chenjunshii]|uniref:Uncharacterized protein n=1 Tax=Streptococcus chenjunshii TaxID=2173853 RepID=A0A372KNI4_9STRE|nr:hypothetical protein [Streptococcus chenjunshii]AXQ79060.1 hypothetical protein DDV21_008160 [Streptococcus chenjunshii]RFU51256.1 hypothetical protein DDV22_04420 [Streptococcus chenjunshii]RFU53128.1 hypothetical protein DDV23_05980 [Streptococcus chenjunshii]
MKKVLQLLKSYLYEFIEPSSKPKEITLKANQIAHTIKQAQKKHLALHAIYGDKSFAGDLVKYDKKEGKLILKNFSQNISTIISIKDIDRLSLVPKTVRYSQTLTNKKN